FRITQFLFLHLVQIAHDVERLAAEVAIHSGWIGHVQNRIALRTALHALEDRRKEAAAPATLPATGLRATGNQHDKAWQIFVLRTEAVRHPRAHRRPALAR